MLLRFCVLSSATCPDDTFTCDSGECITKLNPECDYISDCADGSDEARCGELFFLSHIRLCVELINHQPSPPLFLSMFSLRLWDASQHGQPRGGWGGCPGGGAALAGQSEAARTSHLRGLHHQRALARQRGALFREVDRRHFHWTNLEIRPSGKNDLVFFCLK